MAVVDSTIPDWIPTVDMKCDGKQLTFSVPAALLPITRQILYRRYVGDIGKRDGYQVIWVDQTKANKDLQVSDSDLTDLNNIPSTLRSDLFKSRTPSECRDNEGGDDHRLLLHGEQSLCKELSAWHG